MGEGRKNQLGTYSFVFLANMVRGGIRSPGGVLHWARCIEGIIVFLSPNSRVPRAVTLSITVYARDLHLLVRKDWPGPTMRLESGVR